jgi:hypothetical protein
MTYDEYLVNKYLDKYYTVIVHTYSKKEAEFKIAALGKPDMYNRIDIEKEVNTVFSGVSEVTKYFDTWFDEKLKSFSNNFDKFLNDCELKLGPTSWVVRHKLYGDIDPTLLTMYSNDKRTNLHTLKYFFDKWYDEKVIEVTERMMKNF